MADQQHDDSTTGSTEPIRGDFGSMLYVLGGVPLMIAFFVGLFLMVGSCDLMSVEIPV